MTIWNKEEYTENAVRNKITYLSFTLSILVIYIHSLNLETYGIGRGNTGFTDVVFLTEYYGNTLTRCAVPGFFLVSGFLFFRNFQLGNMIEKWKKRVRTLVIPYLIWASAYYWYSVIYHRIPFIKQYVNAEGQIPISISEWCKWLWEDSYYTLWFLKRLILFVLFTPFIWAVCKEHIKRIPVGLFLLIFTWVLSEKELLPAYIPGNIVYYMVGAYIGLNYANYVYKKSWFLTALSGCYMIGHVATRLRYFNNVTIVLFILAMWFMLDASKRLPNAPWQCQITFFYYVAHDMVLEPVKKITYLVGGKRPITAFVSYLFAPVFTLGILILIAMFMRKITPRLWILITGRNI